MKSAIAVFILGSLVSTSLLAQPRCASVLRSFSAEQINLTFDDLARMALQADMDKAAGLRTSFLQTELKNKTAEVLKEFDITSAELKKELQKRLVTLQNRAEGKIEEASRARKEHDIVLQRHPRFKLTAEGEAPTIKYFIGFTDAKDGHANIVHLQHIMGEPFNTLTLTDPITKQDTVIAKFVVNATISNNGEQLIVFTNEPDPSTTFGKTQILYYSLKTLTLMKEQTFAWPERSMNAYNTSRQVSIGADGDSFAMTTPMGILLMSSFSNLSKSSTEFAPALKDVIALTPDQALVSSNTTVALTKIGNSQARPIALPAVGPLKKLIPIENDQALAMNSDMLFKVDMKDMKILGSTDHVMTDVVLLKQDLDNYVIGIENGKVVLKNLDSFSEKSLFDFNMLPGDMQAEKVSLSADKKTLIIKGSNKEFYDYFWFLEVQGVN